MKKILLLIFSVALLSGFNIHKAYTQVSASVTAHATAEVIEALTAEEQTAMSFGKFTAGNGGVVILTPEGIRTATEVKLSGGAATSGKFFLTGQYEALVSITLPALPVILYNSVSSKTMEVIDWVSVPPAGLGAGKLEKGALAVNVGASLKVGNIEANPVGLYNGTYEITFAYN